MTIEHLESKIKIMNGDAFHRLCDHFLYYDGGDDFESINPIGQTEENRNPVVEHQIQKSNLKMG